MAEHGTYAQLQQHKRAGEEPCDACRQAGSDYTREWRQRPGKADRNRLSTTGREGAPSRTLPSGILTSTKRYSSTTSTRPTLHDEVAFRAPCA